MVVAWPSRGRSWPRTLALERCGAALAGGIASVVNRVSFSAVSSSSLPLSSNTKSSTSERRRFFSRGSFGPGIMVRSASGPATACCSVRSGRSHRSRRRQVRWRGPFPVVARGHARHLRGAARPEVHVVQGLGAMDDPVLVREVHDQAIRLQPVAALGDLDPAQELQQPFLPVRLRARGLDQGGRVVFVLDLQVDLRQQLEAARLPVVGEPAGRAGQVLPLELDVGVALDRVVVAPIDQLVRLRSMPSSVVT